MTREFVRDSEGRPVFAYRAQPGAARKGKRNATPEADLQRAVVGYLKYALPPGLYRVRAGMEGARRSMWEGARAKELGLDRGWPDLMLFSRKARAYRWIELKAPKGVLSADQKAMQADLGDHMAVCRTIEDVERALIAWGITPRCSVHEANRYSGGGI